MELNYAFLANSSDVTPDGRFWVLGGGIDGFVAEGLPAILPALSVVASIGFSIDECDQDYEFRAQIFLPDGTDIGAEAKSKLHPRITAESPGFGPNMKVSLGVFGLLLPQLGRYKFALSVGNQHLGNLFFNVNQTAIPAPREPQ